MGGECHKGSTFGWLTISAPKQRRVDGLMALADSVELSGLLALNFVIGPEGLLVQCRGGSLREFTMRAAGSWGK